MKSFKSIYNHICCSKYETQGFFRYKDKFYDTFMRIKGDVLQGFSLIKSRGIPEYDVEFAVCPLCMPNALFCCGNYRLGNLIIENLIEGWDWR